MSNLNNYDLSNLIMCSGCADEIEDRIRRMNSYNDFKFEKEEKEDDEEEITCNICNNQIEIEDMYTVDNVEFIFAELADEISEDIGGCEHCHGNEVSHLEYLINDDDGYNFEHPSGDEAVSFVQVQGIPFEFANIFVKLIQCPCGYGRESFHHSHNPNGGIFDEHSEIYTKREVDDFYGFDFYEFSRFAAQYNVTIAYDDMSDFREYITKYPMLATDHHVGKAILQTIRSHFEDDKEEKETLPSIVYRGRTRKKDSKKLGKGEMWSPPYGVSSHGRFNSIGLSVLYLCSDKNAIPYEIHPTHEDVVDIATFISQKEMKLFDMGNFVSDFEGFFDEVNQETKTLKNAYLLPNFIGMCCNLVGFDGVKYEGVYNGLEYTNYALFNANQDDNALIVEDVVTHNLEIKFDINDSSIAHTYNEF